MINFEITLEKEVYTCFMSKISRKNINIRIKPENQIHISKPKRVSKRQIKTYLHDNKQWIIERCSKVNNLYETRNNYLTKDYVYIYGNKHNIKEVGQMDIQLIDNYILMNNDISLKKFNQFLNDTLLEYVNIQRKHLDLIVENKNINKPIIMIKNMQGKWGSCYVHKDVIYLNSKLIHYPKFCIDYVLLHEYIHLIVPNHSRQFYELVEWYMPNYKEAIKYLKTN